MLNNCEVDYISGLPDSIVHHIYSVLDPRDVAYTSVLSRTWNRCWCRYPYAVFKFIYHSYYPRIQNVTLWDRNIQNFLDLIERVVLRRIGGEFCLQSFQMYIEFIDLAMLKAYLNRWISIAIGKGVTEFTLRVVIVLGGGFRGCYSVPQVVLQAESLRVLSLSGCTFLSGFDVRLPNLKKFSLHRCEFVDELTLHVLMSGCLMVEYVKISESDLKCKTLSLMNLPLLKHFESLCNQDIENVEIYASNLEAFSFSAASGLWPQRFDLNRCTLLKELRLVGERRSVNFAPEHLISQLPFLEVVEFEDFYNRSHDLVIASQMIKKLAFRNCPALHITADTPNLQSLEICYSGNLLNVVHNVSTILDDVHLILHRASFELLHRLANFLTRRTSLVGLKMVIYDKSSKKMIIHDRLSENLISSMYRFFGKNYICISSKSYTDLMNELIPEVYPKHVHLIHTRDEFVKGMLEKIKNVSSNTYSEHHLVGFKVDKCEAIEDRVDPVTSFFIEKYSIPRYMDSVLELDWRKRGPWRILKEYSPGFEVFSARSVL